MTVSSTRRARTYTSRAVAASVIAGGLLSSLIVTGSGTAAEAVTTCNTALAGTSTRTAPGAGKTVALTFDDSRPEYMPAVLAVLRKYNVRATFFNVGKYDARMPAVLKSAAAQGHLIEPHTWDHAYPTAANGYWAVAYLSNQIKTTAAQQRALTGKPTCFFRPPGGHMNNVNAATKLNNMRTVLWSVDTQDWSQPPYLSATAQAAILKKGTDLRYANPSHPIVLMHAGKASNEPESRVSSFRGNTVAALPKIIAWYKARGYRFVAMDGTSGLVR
jgi:peptidoglycan/xylan/chitin deacetylase (PgdA/CDA1 family)